jgi:hypothetical protein
MLLWLNTMKSVEFGAMDGVLETKRSSDSE